MIRNRVIALIVLTMVAIACGDGREADDTSPTTLATTHDQTTTTRTESTTTRAPTTSVIESTTSTVTAGTIEEIVARVQRARQAEFDALTEKPDGVLGPALIVCEDTGPVSIGDVFACEGVPQTEPDFQLDGFGIVFLVVGPAGEVASGSGTDIGATTNWVEEAFAASGNDLMCRDLLSEEGGAVLPFNVAGMRETDAYFWSLVYWSLAGQPDRMDADGNGIPCETLYSSEVVAEVLAGE